MTARPTFAPNFFAASPTGAGGQQHDAIAVHAASPAEGTALCSAMPLPADGVPDFIHLLPKSPVTTRDGRGPYHFDDAAALIRASLNATGGRALIDENHATDLAAPRGEAAPARGWITGLENRDDGIWGKVEWNATGRQLLGDKAYRFISPVIAHRADGTVTALLRASLTNTPNMPQLAALNSETHEDHTMKKLLAALGVKEDADETIALQAIEKLKSGVSLVTIAKAAGLKDDAKAEDIIGTVTALQQALPAIAKAAGLKEDAKPDAIAQAVTTLAATGGDQKTIVALQQELTEVSKSLKDLRDASARERAETAVDAAIAAGKPGVKARRDHYIARHMIDAKAVEHEFDALPSLTRPSGARETPPEKDKDGNVALNASQQLVVKALGIKPEDMQKTVAGEVAQREAAL